MEMKESSHVHCYELCSIISTIEILRLLPGSPWICLLWVCQLESQSAGKHMERISQ